MCGHANSHESDALVKESIPAVFLLKDEDEGDLVDRLVLQHVRVALLDNLLCLVDTNDFEGMVDVVCRDLLDLEDVVGVEDGLEVLRVQELRLKLVQVVIVGVLQVESLQVHRLQHFQDGGLWVGRFLVQNVRHQLLSRGKASSQHGLA